MKNLILSSLFCFATSLVAQEQETAPTLPPMNPAQLLRMRHDLTFQLQESQRVLALVGQEDKQLLELHQSQQKEIIEQLKDIETQLKAQSVPPAMSGGAMPSQVSPRPPVSSGVPPLPPNFQMLNPMLPPRTLPGTPGPGSGMSQQRIAPAISPPSEFDQRLDPNQAWANSPWAGQPSKEWAEMKNTVEALRQEISELKTTVKALETQIQLLNRNILLSQPQPPAEK